MVELLAAVCILAIISVMLITFLSSGTLQYTKSGNNVAVQKEAQATLNQITEILIDATNGVTYSVNDTLVDSDDNFVPATAETATKKTVCVFNRVSDGASEHFVRSDVMWDANSKTILYSEYKLIEKATGGYDDTPIETNVILAENVEDFSVDLRDVDKNNTVKVAMKFYVKGQTFSAEKTVTIRNHVVVNKGLDETFEGHEVVKTVTVDDVILNPSSVYVEQGSSFSGFQVTVVGENAPGQEVEWEIANPADLSDPAGTSISSNGVVQISPIETCEVIKVKATSIVSKNLHPDDESLHVSEISNVYNKYIYTDSDSVKALGITEFKPSGNLAATATVNVNGVNFEGNEDYSGRIQIEIYDGETKLSDSDAKVESLVKQESSSVSQVSSYKVTIVGSEKYLNKPLTVKATIAGKGTAEAELVFKRAVLNGIRIEAMNNTTGQWEKYQNGEERDSKRGEVIQFRLVGVYKYDDESEEEYRILTCKDSEWTNIQWSAAFADGNGLENRVTDNICQEGTLALGSANSQFNYKSEYTMLVKATYGGYQVSAKLKLPVVSLAIINQYADEQYQVGILTAGQGNNNKAVIRFVIEGLVADGNTVTWNGYKYISSGSGELNYTKADGADEFYIWTGKKGTYTISFYLTNDSSITAKLNVLAMPSNVVDSSNMKLSYYVPRDNLDADIFKGPRHVYYDLYGNEFVYKSTEDQPIMVFDGVTYYYDEKKEVWKP